MNEKLLKNAMFKIAGGLLLMGLLLFGPAGSLKYWNAWLMIGILFIPMLAVGAFLYNRAPELLAKRLKTKETERAQIMVITWSAVIFIAGFVIAGFDYRFGWSHLPGWMVGTAVIVFLAAYAMYAEVMRENAYLSRSVEIQKNQKVIDTGLYGIVRHPMYFATILLFWSMPIVLGSWIAFLGFLFYPFLLVKRIENEEAVLEKGLEGYKEYKKKVPYRILPFIW